MSSASNESKKGSGTALLIAAGGICTGTGIMSLVFGFAPPGGEDFAQQISAVGFNGIEYAMKETTLGINTVGKVGVGLILLGICLMVTGNRKAWQDTGGY